jgi:predicted nucleic acid-binding protein
MRDTVVILDSSAVIAQINVKDHWHQKADAIANVIAHTERRVMLPSEVFAETLNRIGNNIGRHEAVLVGRALLARDATGAMLLTRSTPARATAALALLDTVAAPPDKRPSFIDCLVMATANAYRSREIFGFDAVFTLHGYHVPGPGESQAA